MKRALFITIGTRDIAIDKNRLAQVADLKELKEVYKKNSGGREQMLARPGGALIRKHLKELKSDLKLPIIDPFLTYLTREGKPDFDLVYLIATNQDAEAVKDFALTDTIHFATVLKELLPGLYKEAGKSKFDKIGILEVKEGVAYLDNMFTYFNKLLKTKSLQVLSNYEEIHILNQGGIDAINYGLLLNSLYLYGNKTRLYNVNERSGLCMPLRFGEQFGYEQEKTKVMQAIKRYDYAFVKSSSISPDVAIWAAYAEARLNFDFDTAHQRLSPLGENHREKQVQELMDIEKVRRTTQELTRELYWNAMIKYKQESYVDFVQRFFRIVEQLAQVKALRYLKGLGYDPEDHFKWSDKIKTYLNLPENNGLKDHLENCLVEGGRKLSLESPTIPVFMNILKYYDQSEFNFITQIEPLSKIRNKGIGAHGFEPVSLKQILGKLELTQIQFEKYLETVGKKLKVSANPFDRINQIILDMLA